MLEAHVDDVGIRRRKSVEFAELWRYSNKLQATGHAKSGNRAFGAPDGLGVKSECDNGACVAGEECRQKGRVWGVSPFQPSLRASRLGSNLQRLSIHSCCPHIVGVRVARSAEGRRLIPTQLPAPA